MSRKERAHDFTGVEVTPRDGELPEKMIKRFMRRVRDEGILQELYDRRSYDKPSVRRRRKRSRAAFSRKNAHEK